MKLGPSGISRPFSSIVDLSKVKKLSLTLASPSPPGDIQLDSTIYVLQLTTNIHSLSFTWGGGGGGDFCPDGVPLRTTVAAVVSSVNQSTLRHFDVQVETVDEVKIILNGLKHLFSIRFRVWEPLTSEEIREELTKYTRDSSIQETPDSIFVWFGERLETPHGYKCIKLSHPTGSRSEEI